MFSCNLYKDTENYGQLSVEETGLKGRMGIFTFMSKLNLLQSAYIVWTKDFQVLLERWFTSKPWRYDCLLTSFSKLYFQSVVTIFPALGIRNTFLRVGGVPHAVALRPPAACGAPCSPAAVHHHHHHSAQDCTGRGALSTRLPAEQPSGWGKHKWGDRSRYPGTSPAKEAVVQNRIRTIADVRKPQPTNQKRNYVLNVTGLFDFTLMKTKDSTTAQRPIIKRSGKSGVGHAGCDVQTGGSVVSFVMWHYVVTEEHIKITLRNSTEMWHKHDNFQACLQAPPLGWTCDL